mgnify:CR=1 FL=1
MGDQAQVTNLENGSKVARFSMATTKVNKGKKTADWHKLFAWGNTAHFIEMYGAKGKRIAITGKLVNRTYVSKTGAPRKITEVEVRHVVGL